MPSVATARSLEMIRVLEPEHIAELANFASEIFREYFSQLHTPDKVEYLCKYLLSTEVLIKAIADEGYEYYFVDHDGEHVGFIGVCPHEDHLFLSKLYLKKEARGRGWGREEFEFVKDLARYYGLDTIRLTCARDNVASLDRYDHMGFKKVGKVDSDVGDGLQMKDYILEYNFE